MRNKKNNKMLSIAFYASIALCVLGLVVGFIMGSNKEINYKMENSFEVNIGSYEDLKNWGVCSYNNKITLADDIHITDPDFRIGDDQHPFCGTLDGNGHTIYFDFDSATDNTSLFGTIAPEAVIENVTFKYGELSVEGTTFGGVAKINQGTIRNCKVDYDKLSLTKGGMFSPLVTVNRGNISNVVVDGLANGEKVASVENDILFGNVCVYNYGSIAKTISLGEFEEFNSTDESKIFSMAATNKGIGSVFVSNMESGSTQKVLAVVKEGTYVFDRDLDFEFFKSAEEALTNNRILYDYDFNNRIWVIVNDSMQIKILG